MPGENEPWELESGRRTTQPSRRSIGGSPARVGARSDSLSNASRSNQSARSRDQLEYALGHFLQQQGRTNGGGDQIPSLQNPVPNSSPSATPESILNHDSVDPRLLQLNEGQVQMAEFPGAGDTPSFSTTAENPPVESPGPVRPPNDAEHEPRAGPASPAAEVEDMDVEDIIRELLRYY